MATSNTVAPLDPNNVLNTSPHLESLLTPFSFFQVMNGIERDFLDTWIAKWCYWIDPAEVIDLYEHPSFDPNSSVYTPYHLKALPINRSRGFRDTPLDVPSVSQDYFFTFGAVQNASIAKVNRLKLYLTQLHNQTQLRYEYQLKRKNEFVSRFALDADQSYQDAIDQIDNDILPSLTDELIALDGYLQDVEDSLFELDEMEDPGTPYRVDTILSYLSINLNYDEERKDYIQDGNARDYPVYEQYGCNGNFEYSINGAGVYRYLSVVKPYYDEDNKLVSKGPLLATCLGSNQYVTAGSVWREFPNNLLPYYLDSNELNSYVKYNLKYPLHLKFPYRIEFDYDEDDTDISRSLGDWDDMYIDGYSLLGVREDSNDRIEMRVDVAPRAGIRVTRNGMIDTYYLSRKGTNNMKSPIAEFRTARDNHGGEREGLRIHHTVSHYDQLFNLTYHNTELNFLGNNIGANVNYRGQTEQILGKTAHKIWTQPDLNHEATMFQNHRKTSNTGMEPSNPNPNEDIATIPGGYVEGGYLTENLPQGSTVYNHQISNSLDKGVFTSWDAQFTLAETQIDYDGLGDRWFKANPNEAEPDTIAYRRGVQGDALQGNSYAALTDEVAVEFEGSLVSYQGSFYQSYYGTDDVVSEETLNNLERYDDVIWNARPLNALVGAEVWWVCKIFTEEYRHNYYEVPGTPIRNDEYRGWKFNQYILIQGEKELAYTQGMDLITNVTYVLEVLEEQWQYSSNSDPIEGPLVTHTPIGDATMVQHLRDNDVPVAPNIGSFTLPDMPLISNPVFEKFDVETAEKRQFKARRQLLNRNAGYIPDIDLFDFIYATDKLSP